MDINTAKQLAEGVHQRRVAQLARTDTGYGETEQRGVKPVPNEYSGALTSRHSVHAALKAQNKLRRKGKAVDHEVAGKAVHDAWNKQAQKDIDNPNSKTSSEKKSARQKLINTKYKNLPDDEKEKDRKFSKLISNKRNEEIEYDEMDEGWKQTAANLAISASLLGGVAAHDHLRGADYVKKQTSQVAGKGLEDRKAAADDVRANKTVLLKAKAAAAKLK